MPKKQQTEPQVISLRKLQRERERATETVSIEIRQDLYDALEGVADFLRLPVEVLVNQVIEAFNSMAADEEYIKFPLMLTQVETGE